MCISQSAFETVRRFFGTKLFICSLPVRLKAIIINYINWNSRSRCFYHGIRSTYVYKLAANGAHKARTHARDCDAEVYVIGKFSSKRGTVRTFLSRPRSLSWIGNSTWLGSSDKVFYLSSDGLCFVYRNDVWVQLYTADIRGILMLIIDTHPGYCNRRWIRLDSLTANIFYCVQDLFLWLLTATSVYL